MVRRWVVRLLLLAVVIGVVAALVPGIDVNGGFGNAALLAITAGLSSHLDVDGFGAAVLGGFLIAVFSWLAEWALPVRHRDRLR